MHGFEFLTDLAVIFVTAVGVVLALGRLGLPSVVGFLVAGVLVGPAGLGLVADSEKVAVLAEVGVALLLFTIGLEFSLGRLARIWRFVVLGGGLQVALTVAGAATFAVAMGEPLWHGVFWGYLVALSSTAIVLRSLADREETAAPHGRFIIGVLIFQDLCVVPMMLSMPALAGQAGGALPVLATLAKAAVVVGGVLVLARRVVPLLLARAAGTHQRELFLLTVLSLAIVVASLTASVGLSLALGAFLAGVAVADTDFVHQAHQEVGPFRDAFASLFFVSVGMLLEPGTLVDHAPAVLGVFLLLVLGKFVLATAAGLLMRFPARVAITAGAGLAQVGEFSFVLLGSGQEMGLIGEEQARVFLAASVLSMIAAPLAVAMSPRIAAGARLLRPLERILTVRPIDEPDAQETKLEGHVIVAGLGTGGRIVANALDATRVPYVVVELDPAVVSAERAAGRAIRFGDIASPEVLLHVAEAERARMLVLLLSDTEAGRRAARTARRLFPKLPIVLRMHRLRGGLGDPDLSGVDVVCEDYETSLEITERILHRLGTAGAVVREVISASRHARASDGRPAVKPGLLLQTLALEGVTIHPADRLAGRTVEDCGLRSATGATIVAIARAGGAIANPDPRDRLNVGDTVFLLGSPEQLAGALVWVQEAPA